MQVSHLGEGRQQRERTDPEAAVGALQGSQEASVAGASEDRDEARWCPQVTWNSGPQTFMGHGEDSGFYHE